MALTKLGAVHARLPTRHAHTITAILPRRIAAIEACSRPIMLAAKGRAPTHACAIWACCMQRQADLPRQYTKHAAKQCHGSKEVAVVQQASLFPTHPLQPKVEAVIRWPRHSIWPIPEARYVQQTQHDMRGPDCMNTVVDACSAGTTPYEMHAMRRAAGMRISTPSVHLDGMSAAKKTATTKAQRACTVTAVGAAYIDCPTMPHCACTACQTPVTVPGDAAIPDMLQQHMLPLLHHNCQGWAPAQAAL